MNWLKRRPVVSTVAVIGSLAIAAAAFAYFTSSGSGTATATVGSSSNLALHGTIESSLYPGSSSTVTFSVDNPSSGSEHLGTISLSSITPDAGHSACSTVISGGNPDFTMAPVTVNQTIPSGNGKAITQTGTLTMNDTGINQDACQGATLTLHLSSN